MVVCFYTKIKDKLLIWIADRVGLKIYDLIIDFYINPVIYYST
jgi:hypothetical protein